MQRGVRAGIYSKLFNFQEVIGRNPSSCDHSLLKNHTRYTVSPPCGNALAENFIYPRNRAVHVNVVPAGFRGFFVSNGKQINQI